MPFELLNNALKIINNQKMLIEHEKEQANKNFDLRYKAEKEIKTLHKIHEAEIDTLKSEAIKEFAERLTDKIVNTQSVFTVQKATHDFLSGNAHRQQEILDYVYNLVKEMTEGKDNA